MNHKTKTLMDEVFGDISMSKESTGPICCSGPKNCPDRVCDHDHSDCQECMRDAYKAIEESLGYTC